MNKSRDDRSGINLRKQTKTLKNYNIRNNNNMQPINWEVPEKVTALHAWRRWAARMLDYIVYSFVIITILSIILAFLIINEVYYTTKIFELLKNRNILLGYALGILICIVSILINSIFIYCFGNTLGKRIFGIKIVDINNSPYSFIILIKREILVITRGSGYLLPLLNELIYCLSYKRLISAGSTIWDTQLNFKIIYRPRKLWVTIITILPIILYMCYAYWILYSEIFNFFNT
ncbi:MAG TPA: RDD family protein [Rickettsia endosymbiont of Pyrocoelia pectoralis]|nr:RDD family protein [Rickettsia endosymbiont of Pyrocoelia pectoralis]